ncbi:hypothetical protein AAVH_11944 [Aphelenchoides avenae]|nr:hypothetical protein AAVH_11944 [Aphelenchus avenae]
MANASYESVNTSALTIELSMDTGYHYSLLNGANLKIWEVLTYIGYFLIALLPLGFSWSLWAGNVKIRLENPDDYWSGYRWDITTLPFKTPGGLINAIIGVAYGVPVVSMNVAIFCRLRTLGVKRMSREDTRDEEKNLLALTTIIIAYFVVNVAVSLIFYAAKNMLPSGTVDLLFSIQSFMLDVHVLSAPWLLLLMSTAARQELRRFLGWKQSPVPWAPPSSVYPTLTAGS